MIWKGSKRRRGGKRGCLRRLTLSTWCTEKRRRTEDCGRKRGRRKGTCTSCTSRSASSACRREETQSEQKWLILPSPASRLRLPMSLLLLPRLLHHQRQHTTQSIQIHLLQLLLLLPLLQLSIHHKVWLSQQAFSLRHHPLQSLLC